MKDLLRLSCSGVFIAMNPLQDLVGISHSYLLHEETEAQRGSSICPR